MAGLLGDALSFGTLANGLVTFKKIIPNTKVKGPEARLIEELERLALSAPHMLEDIGFVRDLKACSSEKTVLRRGTHCVIIYNNKQAVAFV